MWNDYLKEQQSLTTDEMHRIHSLMLKEIGIDPEARELYLDLVNKANEYLQIRANWYLMKQEKRAEIDEKRTMTHDSLIVKFNQLARYLQMQGQPADWRNELGYEEDDPYNRKRIGDMGCYLSFISALVSK